MRSLLVTRAARIRGLTLAMAAMVFVGAVARAGTTTDAQTMVYRGHLDQNGAAYTGQLSLGFDFYDTSGNCLDASSCPSTPITVQVLDGEFSVPLIVPPAVLESQTPSIQISINGTPLQGLQRIYPVPFSQRGRTNGPVVVEDGLQVVSSTSDAGPLVSLAGNRVASAGGREIDFSQYPNDSTEAGLICYTPDAGIAGKPALEIVGAGQAGGGREVTLSDTLLVSKSVSAGTLFNQGSYFNLATNDGLTGFPQNNFGTKRALGHDTNDVLTLNVGGDFSGGTQVDTALNVEGNGTYTGYLKANQAGGNVPHGCVVREVTNTCTGGCPLTSCTAYCATGEIAMSGGGLCGYGGGPYDMNQTYPMSLTGQVANGTPPVGWATTCVVEGSNGATQCPANGQWVMCCQY